MAVHMQTFDIRSTGVLSVDIKGLGAILNFLVEIVSNPIHISIEVKKCLG